MSFRNMFCPYLGALARLRPFLTAFIRQQGANVAMMFALAFPAVMLLAGGVVDLSNNDSVHSHIQGAADSAALAGAKAANDYLAVNGAGAQQILAAKTLSNDVAARYISANLRGVRLQSAPSVTVATDIVVRSIKTSVDISGATPTMLLGLVGLSTLPANAHAVSGANPGSMPYYQVIFLVDVSGSMSIGGTPQAINALKANGQIQCAFACHDPNHYYSGVDRRELARNAGIKLKIDFVNDAIEKFVTELMAFDTGAVEAGHFSIGINTYSTTFKTLLAPTSTLSAAKSMANTIDIDPVTPSSTGWGYTYTADALTKTRLNLQNVGDGSSASSKRTFVVFLTDGIQDLAAPGTLYSRTTGVEFGQECAALKAQGASVFAIQARYNPMMDQQSYVDLVSPYTAQISPTLEGCASGPSYYFLASDGPGIQAAVDSSFDEITRAINLKLAH